jgi:hypothetical protein
MSHHQTTRQNQYTKIANELFKNVAKFKYFWTMINISKLYSQRNYEHIIFRKCLLPCSSEPFVFPPATKKTKRLKYKKTTVLPVVLYGCETWSLMSGAEHRSRAFENRVLRRIFGLKWEEVTGNWRKLHNEELIICTLHQILLG